MRYCLLILVIFNSFTIHPIKSHASCTGDPSTGVGPSSSCNSVGSGARAIGMGGAFIGIADDATSATWNPGGMVQLELLEASITTSFFTINENIDVKSNPEASGSHVMFKSEDINYISVLYPFELYNYSMVIAMSDQRLYDFIRKWEFTINNNVGPLSSKAHWLYEQDGGLSALGLSYSINIKPPKLSFGFTLNIWDDQLTKNSWEESYVIKTTGTLAGIPTTNEYTQRELYKLKGFNFHLGMLWRINKKFQIGVVVKTPFTADIEHHFYRHYSENNNECSEVRDEKLSLPLSYGVGMAYNFSKQFHVTADIYRTEWGDYIYTNLNGTELCPITGKHTDQSDIDPTHQVRLGLEYLIEKSTYTLPLRCGLFYDPAPADKNPDDYYGFSLGAGLVLLNEKGFKKNKRYALDIAYQFRYGNNVGTSMFESRGLTQDIKEHKVYMSMIIYTF